ncbi:porin family protein [Methylomonas sp. LL1]|uniref:porin family protein n=1 Tax=Methylomonas sp. LL1 TaxID=2785785 RepID=UPI0018C3ACD9|nr:porin family protein [Methylomonas sp. LL1]QPK63094.1 porin family protein [Methylomonas sp. LL1]
MILNKTQLALGIAAASLAMAFVAPVQAADTKAERVADAAARKTEALESQMQQMADQMQAMQAELSRVKASSAQASTESAKVQELDSWMASMKSAPAATKTKDNMVFFRGGYANPDNKRGGTLDPTSVAGVATNRNGVTTGAISDSDAWYFGAGFDFSLSDDLFGIWDGTEVLAELNVEYKELADKKPNGLSAQEVAVVNSLGFNMPNANTESATVNQLSVSASPKIKFMKGSKFRPWLIPVGFDINVISPPSDAITVLNTGIQFGAGADYNLWKNLFVGADVRYHYSTDDIDGVRTDGMTAGGYLGIGF